MASLFQSRFEARARQADLRAFGVSVVFRRGIVSLTVDAVATELEYPVLDADGIATQVVTYREYSVATEDLVNGTQSIEPREGDLIVEAIAGGNETFEVMPLAGKKAVELQRGGYRWTIRAKRVR